MDLFLREAADRIGDDDVLAKIDTLMNWRSFSPILKRGLKRTGIGPQGYDPLVLFKCLQLGDEGVFLGTDGLFVLPRRALNR